MKRPLAIVGLPLAWLFVTACGGKAIVDPPIGAGGAGAGTSPSSTSTTTPSSTSSSGGPACTSIFDCCEKLCDVFVDLGCSNGCEIENECAQNAATQECLDATITFFRCALENEAARCDGDEPQPECGPCDDELEAYNDACDGALECG